MADQKMQPMGGTIGQQYPPGTQPPKYTPERGPANLSPQNINATAPAPYQQFGNIPTLDPTYWKAAMANPFQQQQYLKQYDTLYQKGLQPTFNQQDLALSQDLASRGISDSSAASYNMGNLYAQQGAQVAQGEAPMVQQAFAQTQQDVLANQAARNSANSSNAAASNAAAAANANYYNNAVTGNMDAYNQYQNALFGGGSNWENSLLSAYLNSFGPQTGVTNALGQELAGEASAYSSANAGQDQTLGALFGAAGQYGAAAAAGKSS